jgi:FAD/FMN-containing dehydrogenase
MAWVSAVRHEWEGETRVSLGTSYEAVDIPQPVIAVGTTAFGSSREATARIVRRLDDCPVRGRALSSRRDWQTSFAELYERRDRAYPDGQRWAADTMFSSQDPRACISMLAEDIARAPSPASHLLFVLPRGPMPTLPPPGGALTLDGDFVVDVYATWSKADDDRANLEWVERVARKVEPSVTGHYVGEVDLIRWPIERCFSPEAWLRLQDLRDRYDPDRRFIEPVQPGMEVR